MSSVPAQKRGESKQDYATPWEIIHALESRFGKLHIDLAASKENTKCTSFVTEEDNTFSFDWVSQWGYMQCWLNPPFENIGPWAERCADYAMRAKTGRLFFLTPASVGANWYRDFVDKKAYVLFLNGRLTFIGEKSPYPKDCMISVFGSRIAGSEVWDWRQETK